MRVPNRHRVVRDGRQPAWPLLLAVLAAFGVGTAAGVGARLVDRLVGPAPLAISLAAYRSLLAAAVSGLITVVVFALWMRTVMAGVMAGKVAPRVLARRLDDRYQRFVLTSMTVALGVAVGALATLPAQGPVAAVVSLPLVLTGGVAGLAGVLISLNRAVIDLSVPTVLFDLVQRGKRLLRAREAARRSSGDPDADPAKLEHRGHVRAAAMGWVREVDHDALLRHLPAGHGLTVRVGVGELVDEGDVLASTSCELASETEAGLRSAIALGRHDGERGTVDHVIGQVVDMACHAMEPGTDDTSTGVEATEATGLLLRGLLRVGDPVRHAGDAERQLLDVASPGVRETVRRSVERLRLTVAARPQSAFRLVRILGDVADAAREAGRDEVVTDLSQQVQRLVQSAHRSELSSADVDELIDLAQSRGLIGPRPIEPVDEGGARTG